jgi:hypothetical protein
MPHMELHDFIAVTRTAVFHVEADAHRPRRFWSQRPSVANQNA